MNKIFITAEFKRKVKPLAKKYHTLKENIDHLVADLIHNPFLGISYGANIYKIRLADESKGTGKSGGFRVIYYLSVRKAEGVEILLVTIFDKNERDTIKKKDVELLVKNILADIEINEKPKI